MGYFFFTNAVSGKIKNKYPNLFQGGNIRSKKASIKSGIGQWGWYGEILNIAGNPLQIKEVEQMNMYDFLNYISYNRAMQIFQNYDDK